MNQTAGGQLILVFGEVVDGGQIIATEPDTLTLHQVYAAMKQMTDRRLLSVEVAGRCQSCGVRRIHLSRSRHYDLLHLSCHQCCTGQNVELERLREYVRSLWEDPGRVIQSVEELTVLLRAYFRRPERKDHDRV